MICKEFIESVKDAYTVVEIIEKDKQGTCLANKAVWQYAQVAKDGKSALRDFLVDSIGAPVMRTIEGLFKCHDKLGKLCLDVDNTFSSSFPFKMYRFFWESEEWDAFVVFRGIVDPKNESLVEKWRLCVTIYNTFPNVCFSEIAHTSDDEEEETGQSDDCGARWKIVTIPPLKTKKRKGGRVKEVLDKL